MKGSFKYLYTFEEVATIYEIDNSTLRKRVASNKFEIDKDVKKFGKTWLMTEDAMIKYFGEDMLSLYKNQLKLSNLESKKENNHTAKSSKSKKSKKNNDDIELLASDNIKEDAGWDNDEIEGQEIMTFSFGENK